MSREQNQVMGNGCTSAIFSTADRDTVARTSASPEKSIVDQPQASSSANKDAPSSEYGLRTSGYNRSSSSRPVVSVANVVNARYSLVDPPKPDHWNEDAHFRINDNPRFQVMAVFDGHDGSNAVEFVCEHFHKLFSRHFLHNAKKHNVEKVLEKFFESAEDEFFKHIGASIEEKKSLQSRIPVGLTSYEAYVQYPQEVARLQELEPKIAGGTTAVIAVIYNEQLYVANTGDSRAYIIEELSDGTLAGEQLSTDHGMENKEELMRLQFLGLDVEELKKSGRLGTQENTRSIGDYCIKGGYKDVDVLSNASEPPGIAIPSIKGPIPIKSSFRYLLLMSDGVYKSIEAILEPQTNETIESSKVLLVMLIRYLKSSHDNVHKMATTILDRIRNVHEDTYKTWAREKNPLAVQCRKRDDMTLVVFKFSGQVSTV